jgi:hypothetical protein
MFDFFKILFFNDSPLDPHITNIDDKKVSPKQTYNIDEVIEQKPKLNNQIKLKENIISKPSIIHKHKEQAMAEIFLVVIDTTGRVEAKNFQPGIQNFYFVYAENEQNAKDIVLSTFIKRPGLVGQLQYSTKATPLSIIIKNIGKGSNFWTYVPMGSQRQAGQQAAPPSPDKLLGQDMYGEQSAQAFTPTHVVSEEITADELRGVQFSGEDAKIVNSFKNTNSQENNSQSDLVNEMLKQNKAMAEQNQLMMSQMLQLMSKVTTPASPE